MIKITVRKRSCDYMAFLEGDTAQWGAGRSQAEAIGDVILSHKEICGIEVDHD